MPRSDRSAKRRERLPIVVKDSLDIGLEFNMFIYVFRVFLLCRVLRVTYYTSINSFASFIFGSWDAFWDVYWDGIACNYSVSIEIIYCYGGYFLGRFLGHFLGRYASRKCCSDFPFGQSVLF